MSLLSRPGDSCGNRRLALRPGLRLQAWAAGSLSLVSTSFKNPRSVRLHQVKDSIRFEKEIRGELSLAFFNQFVGVQFHDRFALMLKDFSVEARRGEKGKEEESKYFTGVDRVRSTT